MVDRGNFAVPYGLYAHCRASVDRGHRSHCVDVLRSLSADDFVSSERRQFEQSLVPAHLSLPPLPSRTERAVATRVVSESHSDTSVAGGKPPVPAPVRSRDYLREERRDLRILVVGLVISFVTAVIAMTDLFHGGLIP